jgi:hypothetical protein
VPAVLPAHQDADAPSDTDAHQHTNASPDMVTDAHGYAPCAVDAHAYVHASGRYADLDPYLAPDPYGHSGLCHVNRDLAGVHAERERVVRVPAPRAGGEVHGPQRLPEAELK